MGLAGGYSSRVKDLIDANVCGPTWLDWRCWRWFFHILLRQNGKLSLIREMCLKRMVSIQFGPCFVCCYVHFCFCVLMCRQVVGVAICWPATWSTALHLPLKNFPGHWYLSMPEPKEDWSSTSWSLRTCSLVFQLSAMITLCQHWKEWLNVSLHLSVGLNNY